MPALILIFALVNAGAPGFATSAAAAPPLAASAQPLGHGGGCRADSPEGQCCHFDKATQKTHCH